MSSTSTLITHLLDFSGNTISRQRMLEFINIAQNELTDAPSKVMRENPDPILTTTAATYTYTMPAGVRRISRVFLKGYYVTGYLGAYSNTLLNLSGPFTEIRKGYDASGNSIYEVPVITTESLDPETADCKIIFPSHIDPGSTTDKYYLEQYNWPTQLTSENIELSIPKSFHTKVLKYHVLMNLEEMGFGNARYNVDRYEKALSDWRRFANRTINQDPNYTSPRVV